MDFFVSGVCLEANGVGAGVADGFPEAVGLGWLDAGAADLIDEEAGDEESLVAEGFGIEPVAWGAGVEAVFWVGFEFV